MRAYQNLAAISYSRGDLQRAEQMARRALEIDASYFDAWNTLGAVYLMMGRPSDAIEALTKAVAARSDSGQAHYNLALAHQARGDPQAATDSRARACRLDARFCG